MNGGQRWEGVGGDPDQEVVWRCIYRIDDDEYWRHGAAEYRRPMRLDGRAHGGGRCVTSW